jgi:hypothetical protein
LREEGIAFLAFSEESMHSSNGTTSQIRPPFFCPKLVADSGRWITKKRESQHTGKSVLKGSARGVRPRETSLLGRRCGRLSACQKKC